MGYLANKFFLTSSMSPSPSVDGVEELIIVAPTSLGSLPSSDATLGTHQTTTLITQPSKTPHNSLNVTGMLSIAEYKGLCETKPLEITTSMPLCLHTSINLENSVFSSTLVVPPDISPQDWIIDGGATNHMVHSIKFLT